MFTKTLFIACACTSMTLISATDAAAQAPGWAIGTWQGTLQNYISDPSGADRALAIGANGSCVWDLPAKLGDIAQRLADPTAAKTCHYTDNTVSLTTGPGSTLLLKNAGGKLEGTFQLKSGKTFYISMTKK